MGLPNGHTRLLRQYQRQEAAREAAKAAAMAVLKAADDTWDNKRQLAGEMIQKADDYVVPAGREIWVVNKTGTLKKHRTKKENRFAWERLRTNEYRPEPLRFWYSWGQLKSESGESVTVPELGKAGYLTFATGNENWPYMVVPKWVFAERGPDVSDPFARKLAGKLDDINCAVSLSIDAALNKVK